MNPQALAGVRFRDGCHRHVDLLPHGAELAGPQRNRTLCTRIWSSGQHASRDLETCSYRSSESNRARAACETALTPGALRRADRRTPTRNRTAIDRLSCDCSTTELSGCGREHDREVGRDRTCSIRLTGGRSSTRAATSEELHVGVEPPGLCTGQLSRLETSWSRGTVRPERGAAAGARSWIGWPDGSRTHVGRIKNPLQ